MPVALPPEYRLTVEVKPGYVHAKVDGARTPENAARFLREAHEACVSAGRSAVLMEMHLSGPSLGSLNIFHVISQASPRGAMLRRIAYVDTFAGEPDAPRFAETVAQNRGVNVRLFPDVAAAEAWLAEEG
jgi:hypothetical protein